MIEKTMVRREIGLLEMKIKEEIKIVENEIRKMDEACDTIALQSIWGESKKNAELHERLATLRRVLSDIQDLRCCDAFADGE